MSGFLPRTITLPDGRDIALVGVSGMTAQTSWLEDVPLTAAYAEVAESICEVFS